MLQPGHEVLLAGARAAQLAMGNTLVLETTSAYVASGQHLPGQLGVAPVQPRSCARAPVR